MHLTLTTPLALALALLPTLIHATACVAGGPSFQVSQAHTCCSLSAGTWYQFYPVQAICVMDDGRSAFYQRCVDSIENSLVDSTCIPGQGPVPSGILTSATGRVTITAPAAAAGTGTGS